MGFLFCSVGVNQIPTDVYIGAFFLHRFNHHTSSPSHSLAFRQHLINGAGVQKTTKVPENGNIITRPEGRLKLKKKVQGRVM
jgi:hypothetical protein